MTDPFSRMADPADAARPQAPLCRPLLSAAVMVAVIVAGQSPDRLRAFDRAALFLGGVAGIWFGAAFVVWGWQRNRRQRWPFYVEMSLVLGIGAGLMVAAAVALISV